MPIKPIPSAKNESGDLDKFTNFMQRLVSVPHSEIKAKLDAQKAKKRTPRTSSRASASSPKQAN